MLGKYTVHSTRYKVPKRAIKAFLFLMQWLDIDLSNVSRVQCTEASERLVASGAKIKPPTNGRLPKIRSNLHGLGDREEVSCSLQCHP